MSPIFVFICSVFRVDARKIYILIMHLENPRSGKIGRHQVYRFSKKLLCNWIYKQKSDEQKLYIWEMSCMYPSQKQIVSIRHSFDLKVEIIYLYGFKQFFVLNRWVKNCRIKKLIYEKNLVFASCTIKCAEKRNTKLYIKEMSCMYPS